MKYFSMFSGIGGFENGIEKAYNKKRILEKRPKKLDNSRYKRYKSKFNGCFPKQKNKQSSRNFQSLGRCVGFSEIDKYAIQIYKRHFPEHKNYGDATKIIPEELPDFDLLCGGFPCQSFSIAGKRKGFEDTRGTLFFDICRIARVKRPSYIFLENVRGLLSHDNGYTFLVILESLAELGYSLQWQVLNSKNFGVPQNRERVFIIGHLAKASPPKVFPFTRQNSENFKKGIIYRRNIISRTIVKNYGDISGDSTKIMNSSGVRRLTPKECERLQGFPDRWTEKGIDRNGNEVGISDTQRYKVLGNAVTVNAIKAIMTRWLGG